MPILFGILVLAMFDGHMHEHRHDHPPLVTPLHHTVEDCETFDGANSWENKAWCDNWKWEHPGQRP